MSDIICLRRSRSNGQSFTQPKACVTFPRGEFRFYQLALQLMNIDREKEALMFYINKKDKSVKIEIEDKQSDNYWLSEAKGYFRFTNKDLSILFSDVLDLEYDGKHYFLVEKENDKEFKMKLTTV